MLHVRDIVANWRHGSEEVKIRITTLTWRDRFLLKFLLFEVGSKNEKTLKAVDACISKLNCAEQAASAHYGR